jgi:outer membrane receptor protein involved in Fe transport
MVIKKKLLSVTISVLVLNTNTVLVQQLQAQEGLVAASTIEEIVILGRLQTSADEIAMEREQSAVVADFIDTTAITRIGDSNVATALRRVPGVTLIDDKYVFVRGLGERYSTSQLNGTQIPSPDLTRNVIPLDIFPTQIVRSIAVQKGYAADMPASFSGGLIDIRTTSIPDGLTYSFNLGSTFNSESTGKALGYDGGGDDWLATDDGTRGLSPALQNALNLYSGSLSPSNILSVINSTEPASAFTSFSGAQAANRDLALLINRNVDVRDVSRDPNLNLDANVGNNFFFDNGMEFGFLVAGAYGKTTLSRERVDRSVGRPFSEFSETDETTQNVNMTGNVNLGLAWYDEHSIETTSLLLRNTDDDAFIRNFYTSSRDFDNGAGFRNYGTRYEERELTVNQIRGNHRLGSITRDLLNFDELVWLSDLEIDWYFSDSTAETSLPNESQVTYQTTVDEAGNVLTQSLRPGTNTANFRFTDLEDEVESSGIRAMLPVYLNNAVLEVSGGYEYTRKVRDYRQLEFAMGTPDSAIASGFSGLPSTIFSDSNIQDSTNNFVFDVVGSNGESYLAAIDNSAVYGELDYNLNETYRITAGVRWEDYKQLGIPWDPLEYDGCQISCNTNDILDSLFADDDYYPSLSFTYMRPYFWAETFQFRLGYSETLVRPDLREITPSSYFDPITGAIVSGNANVIPATVKNYDARAEWFFDNGDNFTVSLFYKDIADPIDFFEAAAFEEAVATEIQNADSAEIVGLEIEFLKDLWDVADILQGFFIQGNITFLDSELVAGPDADAPTNAVRDLAGASEALNLQLGWDSDTGRHSASLVYNVNGERLFYAGRNGAPDAFEQPFHSLDLSYFFFPTDNWTLRVRAQNLLDEEVTVERQGVEVFNQKSGTTLRFDLRWRY